jgi:DUF1365 family protein
LDTLDARLRFFSRNRRNWLEFRDSDHLPNRRSLAPRTKKMSTRSRTSNAPFRLGSGNRE